MVTPFVVKPADSCCNRVTSPESRDLPESDDGGLRSRHPARKGGTVPFYQFTIPSDSPSAGLKTEIARAVTKVHTAVTGAPARYVNVSFVEVPPGSLFVGDEPVTQGRMVGIIRSGRTAEVQHELITGLADAWSAVTGEPRDGFALFLQEVPGSMVMEYGDVLPEAEFD
jgi:phenylpyruvate tautomerase PptA (4-oxalocrotonate tautomerase family)